MRRVGIKNSSRSLLDRNKTWLVGVGLIIIGLGLIFGMAINKILTGIETRRFRGEEKIVDFLEEEKEGSSQVETNLLLDEKLEEWQKINKEVKARLLVEGTMIDYPVVHRPKEKLGDFYLRRDLIGRYAEGGTLFFDKNNKMELNDQNLIIFGHNMPNEAMFGGLERFKDQKFYEKNQKIKLTIKNKDGFEIREYQIFATILSRVKNKQERGFRYYYFYNSKNEEEFQQAVSEIKKMMIYPTELVDDLKWEDELITLSTCEYSQKDGRLAVLAKRIK